MDIITELHTMTHLHLLRASSSSSSSSTANFHLYQLHHYQPHYYQLHHYQLHHLQSYSPEQDMATSYLYSWAILWLCVDKVGGTSWDRLSVNIVCSEKSSAEFNLGEDMTLHRRAFLVEWFHVTPTEPCWKYLVEWAYNHVSWAI